MKTIILIAGLVMLTSVGAQTYVNPHVTKNGTYVEGHYRTAPNNTKVDNYSSQGNYNPYTGQAGRVDPYAQPQQQQNTYQQPRQQVCGYTQSGQYVCR